MQVYCDVKGELLNSRCAQLDWIFFRAKVLANTENIVEYFYTVRFNGFHVINAYVKYISTSTNTCSSKRIALTHIKMFLCGCTFHNGHLMYISSEKQVNIKALNRSFFHV